MTTKSPKGLLERTADAGTWTVAGKLGGRCIDLITLLILARLLDPKDFGLVAMAMTIVVIAEAVFELPLGQALLRVEELTPPMFDTAFTLSVLRGLLLAVLLGLAAWPMSVFYAEPRLVALVCASSLAPILRGSGSPRMVVFMRAMDFRRDLVVDIAGKLAALAISSMVAVTTGSYWAITAATISAPLVAAGLSYFLAPYSPRFTLSEWSHFSDMIGWYSASQFISALNWQIDRLLLGRFIPHATLGRFAMASDLAAIPLQSFVGPLIRPMSAAFSAGQNRDIGAAYGKAAGAAALILAPVFLSIALLSEPLIRLAFGRDWLQAAPILFWLSLIALIEVPSVLMSPLAMALNRTRLVTLRALAECGVKVPAMIIGVASFGVPGAIGARAIAAIVASMASMHVVKLLTGTSLLSQVSRLWRVSLALAALGICLALLRPAVAAEYSQIGLAMQIALAVTAGGLVYLFVTAALWSVCGRPDGIERMAARRLGALFSRNQAPQTM
jgi:O-antigen/teichoic acid export membrane protein